MCSFSHLSSSLLRPDRDVCVGMDLYRWYEDFSPKSKGSVILSQSKHWSGVHWVCQTCSAAPVLVMCWREYQVFTPCSLVRGGTVHYQVVALRRYSRVCLREDVRRWCKKCSEGQQACEICSFLKSWSSYQREPLKKDKAWQQHKLDQWHNHWRETFCPSY